MAPLALIVPTPSWMIELPKNPLLPLFSRTMGNWVSCDRIAMCNPLLPVTETCRSNGFESMLPLAIPVPGIMRHRRILAMAGTFSLVTVLNMCPLLIPVEKWQPPFRSLRLPVRVLKVWLPGVNRANPLRFVRAPAVFAISVVPAITLKLQGPPLPVALIGLPQAVANPLRNLPALLEESVVDVGVVNLTVSLVVVKAVMVFVLTC